MVAKVVCGKSIRKALYYNEQKVQHAEAKLLLAVGFPRDAGELTFRNKLDRYNYLTTQNERTKTNALHITLNFSVRDKVDEDTLKLISLEYMTRIGWGDQPFLLYQHFDAAHPHVHIVTTNIADGGVRLETHNIGKNQSEKARKELESIYGLIKAEEQQKDDRYLLKPVDLSKAMYGKSQTKASIANIVRSVVSSYKFTSLPEFNAILRQFNVVADRGQPGTPMYEKKGLVYRLLDEDGNKIGVPIKASSIFSSPTLDNLEKLFTPNIQSRKPYGERLKHILDKAISASKDINEVATQLQQKGVRILLRNNAQGEVYGVTFIDNATACVFNGSDLGKTYSAAAFMERLEKATSGEESIRENVSKISKDYHTATTGNDTTLPKYPAAGQPVIELLWDTALSDKHEENAPDPLRKRKKKRQQIE